MLIKHLKYRILQYLEVFEDHLSTEETPLANSI